MKRRRNKRHLRTCNFIIFFAVLQSTGTMYTQNECPHLKNKYRIRKREMHPLESTLDPKTQLKTIVLLGMEVQLL